MIRIPVPVVSIIDDFAGGTHTFRPDFIVEGHPSGHHVADEIVGLEGPVPAVAGAAAGPPDALEDLLEEELSEVAESTI